MMNKGLENIISYLNEKRGLDFSGCRFSMIARRVNKRVMETRSGDYVTYLKYIETNHDELDRLLDVLTINVSRFFRGALAFEYIAERILPSIVLEKMAAGDESLRVWSAGCSTGEEPYSIAILIRELLKKEDCKLTPVIFASDIDAGAIRKAKEAIYLFDSIKDVKYRFLDEYFRIDGESYRLGSKVRELVSFSVYDLLDKKTFVPPESVFGSFDMVLCRNVLIYFHLDYQDMIWEKLYRALEPRGYLILGPTESPTRKYREHFRTVCKYCHIYQKI